ncbi:hypothetical protein [Halopenitus sp. POP-27]|uniref:hypothetical protein n=1 Tax=Halopenitus sp. POP-27 TaxID=2994425 RepID=UPI002469C34B|nr:hypothetical protein [Halopenitus sp. POP-27]
MEIPQIWTTLGVVLASFLGGIVAVLIGQFLSFYREQIDRIQELQTTIRLVNHLDEDTVVSTDNPQYIRDLKEDLKRNYFRNKWWISNEVQNEIEKLFPILEESEVCSNNIKELYDTMKLGVNREMSMEGWAAGERNKEILKENINEANDISGEALENLEDPSFRKHIWRFLGRVN